MTSSKSWLISLSPAVVVVFNFTISLNSDLTDPPRSLSYFFWQYHLITAGLVPLPDAITRPPFQRFHPLRSRAISLPDSRSRPPSLSQNSPLNRGGRVRIVTPVPFYKATWTFIQTARSLDQILKRDGEFLEPVDFFIWWRDGDTYQHGILYSVLQTRALWVVVPVHRL